MAVSLAGKEGIDLGIEDGNNVLDVLSLCAWTTSSTQT